MRAILTVLFILFLCSITESVTAQIFSRNRARKNELPPKALLVQLPTYQRRLAAFEKEGNNEKIQQLKKDRDSVTTKIIMDFEDNLNYCPVYYFYDNDLDKIKTGNLNGTLFSADLSPITKKVLDATDTNYQIIMFGNVVVPTEVVNGRVVMSPNQPSNNKQRLQVFDHKYRKLKEPLPTGTNNIWGGHTKKDRESYKYDSPMFEIYYEPYVARYNGKLFNFYGKYPY